MGETTNLFGAFLRELRGTGKLSATAAGLGYSTSYLWDIERGLRRPGGRALLRLCNAIAMYFKLSVSDVLLVAAKSKGHILLDCSALTDDNILKVIKGAVND